MPANEPNCFSWPASALESVFASPLIHVLPAGSWSAMSGNLRYAVSPSRIASSFQSSALAEISAHLAAEGRAEALEEVGERREIERHLGALRGSVEAALGADGKRLVGAGNRDR